MSRKRRSVWLRASLYGFTSLALGVARVDAADGAMDPAKMARLATVDERFQSYNVEMVEVIGGWFWKPYATRRNAARRKAPGAQHAGAVVVQFAGAVGAKVVTSFATSAGTRGADGVWTPSRRAASSRTRGPPAARSRRPSS